MASRSNDLQHDREQPKNDTSYNAIDYAWFATRFENLLERLEALENTVTAIEQSVTAAETAVQSVIERDYYTVPEFATLVERTGYTVREWCRLERINAEKCDSGRGDAKGWKIPADELQRYRDHGLLAMTYLR